jgi:hypothetical protein
MAALKVQGNHIRLPNAGEDWVEVKKCGRRYLGFEMATVKRHPDPLSHAVTSGRLTQ